MSGTITKHRNALGWAWYLDTDEGSYWVSHPVKEHIESLEAENAKLRELAMWSIRCSRGLSCHECPFSDIREATVCSMLRHAEKMGIEVD